jgi:hypothetical protein
MGAGRWQNCAECGAQEGFLDNVFYSHLLDVWS